MRNFLIGLVVGVSAVGRPDDGWSWSLRWSDSRAPSPTAGERVADGSTLVLKLEGEVPERLPRRDSDPVSRRARRPCRCIRFGTHSGKQPPIRASAGILFEPRGLDIGWAKMEEIHDEIVQFKKSGKPIITYLRSPTRARILSGVRYRQHFHFAGRLSRSQGLARRVHVLQTDAG